MKFNFKQIKRILAPEPEIGAIEINNKVVKAFCFSNDGNFKTKYSVILPLPNNTINNGVVSIPENLTKVLTDLKKEINKKGKISPYVIVSLPAQNFFTNILNIPKLSKTENLGEAIKLNLRLLSPINLDTAYFDWELIEDNEFQNNLTVFASVGDKLNIDKYLDCLTKANFKVMAVEKPALGLLRFVKQYSKPESYYLIANIDRDGADIIVARKDRLVFYDFDSLGEIAKYDLDVNLSATDFQIYLTKKIAQVANFCQSRQNEIIKKFYLFSVIPEIKNDLIKNLSSTFQLEPLALTNNAFTKVPEEWYSIIGTAIRGTIPRVEDTMVSLMATGTEAEYSQSRILKLFSLWTKIGFTIFASLALLYFGMSTIFFSAVEEEYVEKKGVSNGNNVILDNKIKVLEAEALKYNSNVVKITNAINRKTTWEDQIKFAFDLAKKSQIDILKVFISNETRNVTIQASAPSQNSISNFRDDLENTKKYQNVTAPLESISSEGSLFYFQIKFTLGV